MEVQVYIILLNVKKYKTSKDLVSTFNFCSRRQKIICGHAEQTTVRGGRTQTI